MPKGVAQIEVTFDIDANGILAVSAREKTSGKKASIRIENKDKLSAEEVDRMVRDAEEFKDDDQIALERVEAKAALEEYIHECKKALKDKELRGRMEDDDLDMLQGEIRAADDWVDSQEMAAREEFEEKLRELRDDTLGPILTKYEGGAGGGEAPYEHEEL